MKKIDRNDEEFLAAVNKRENFNMNSHKKIVNLSADETLLQYNVGQHLIEEIDWHDQKFLNVERSRVGNGERGEPATFPADYDNEKCNQDEVFEKLGYNGCLSDYISVNRSMPDCRHEDCVNIKYRRYLPKASVIIPVHDEHWSVLLRAIYSVLNRSPAALLEEIIVVDDGSTATQMKQELDDYVGIYLRQKVRVLRIPSPRKGLMTARMLGARYATGKVLVFLDSNIEANVNWLPPLLEPIAESYKTTVCPIIDVIDAVTFQITGIEQGNRNGFDWTLLWRWMPLFPEDELIPTKPFKSPVMVGCAFAISKRFFWELGGYDPGLQLWGGEQYELAFKVWQCGGILLDIPCSRVAHIFRAHDPKLVVPINADYRYIDRNYKRVAEVWMDEYKEYVYRKKPHLRSIDAGDLSKQHELRDKLKCKPFSWFMKHVAFDILERYPLVEPPDYGFGRITPILDGNSCLTGIKSEGRMQLDDCTIQPESTDRQQKFILSWRKDIRTSGEKSFCMHMDLPEYDPNVITAPVAFAVCHDRLGNQLWRYHLDTKQVTFHSFCDLCLACNGKTKDVFIEKCDETKLTQRWLIESINIDEIRKWDERKPLVHQKR